MPSCFEDDPLAGVVVDFSAWIHRAYHLVDLGGMAKMVSDDLRDLLTDPLPAWVAVAVDPRERRGRRYEATRHLDPDDRYKAGRDGKPPEFYAIADRLLDVVAMHRIPILFPADYCEQDFEADDAIATAVRLARGAGLPVTVLTRDKDLAQLVTDEAPSVVLWDGNGRVRTERDIAAMPGKRSPGDHGEAFGVPPSLLRDWLAMVGDRSDNVIGAGRRVPGPDNKLRREGIGAGGATMLLRALGSLDAALEAPVRSADERAAVKKKLDQQAGKISRLRKKGQLEADWQAIADAIPGTREALQLEAELELLQANREAALLSRKLVTLDDEAPIAWDWSELPVGDFNVEGLRRAYANWGWSALAGAVHSPAKRPLPVGRSAA